MDLVVRNGTVVTAEGSYAADLGVKDGRIVQIGGDMGKAAETIDAAGCLLLPGGVDVHTHLDAPGPFGNTADDFASGTIAAACGGTTTIVDFCQQAKGQSLKDALALWHAKAEGKAVIDYGFHIIVVDLNEATFAELALLPDQGVTSFKLFMAYKGAQMVEDLTLLRVLEQARDHGALVMVHAENGDAVLHLQRKLLAEGKTAPKYHAESRPPRVESEATGRAIALAELVAAPLYIVHLTCEDSLDEVVRGRRRGVDVFAETCTHYLYVTKDDLDRDGFEGAKFVFSPAPRTAHDHAVLWRALSSGDLQAASSDHGTWRYRGQRDKALRDFTRIPNGATGIEERMTMIYQGVVDGRLSPSRFVDVCATMPARLFGLYPQKGTIAVGSDADLVIWDPSATRVITQDALHHGNDFSLYEGRQVRGAPRTVTVRGRVVVRDGNFVGTPGGGRYIKRRKFSLGKY